MTADADMVLELIRQHIDDTGYPPSIRWLAYQTLTPQTTVYERLRQLVADGRIRREPGRARAITIIDREDNQ